MQAQQWLVFLGFGLASSFAVANDIVAGEYLAAEGLGTLTIGSAKGKTTFKIETVGANGSACVLEGVVIKGVGRTLSNLPGDKPCEVGLKREKDGINIEARTPKACSLYCGARAFFDFLYLNPKAGCTKADMSARHARFQQRYNERRYDEALLEARHQLEICGHLFGEISIGLIRNEIADTQYRLKDYAGCLRTLAPYAAAVKSMQANPPTGIGSMDDEAYVDMLENASDNIEACQINLESSRRKQREQ